VSLSNLTAHFVLVLFELAVIFFPTDSNTFAFNPVASTGALALRISSSEIYSAIFSTNPLIPLIPSSSAKALHYSASN